MVALFFPGTGQRTAPDPLLVSPFLFIVLLSIIHIFIYLCTIDYFCNKTKLKFLFFDLCPPNG